MRSPFGNVKASADTRTPTQNKIFFKYSVFIVHKWACHLFFRLWRCEHTNSVRDLLYRQMISQNQTQKLLIKRIIVKSRLFRPPVLNIALDSLFSQHGQFPILRKNHSFCAQLSSCLKTFTVAENKSKKSHMSILLLKTRFNVCLNFRAKKLVFACNLK